MSVTDEIRNKTEIVDIVSQHVSLKKSGKTFKGNCPFHVEKTPSFYVYPENWSYHCFGCGAHGDGFDFTMATQKMDFGEALRFLAQKAGVTLAERRADAQEDSQRQRLRELHEAAVQYCSHLLLNSPAGKQAHTYLEKRGLNRETIEAFQLGYTLNSWDAIGKYLTSKGYSQDEILAAGLVVQREDGTVYDRFRNRLMFPIRDRAGAISGFGARSLDDTHPKYINSPDTILFEKSASLYAIDKAATAIRGRDMAIIVEGYLDALMAHQYGFQNVIASMGTALTERQIRVLKRLSKNLALALDPDAAGDEATLRGLDVAREAFDRKVIAIPTWQGLVRFEHRLDAEIKIITLPRGKDPDEIIKESPPAWVELVDGAQPTVDFLFRVVSARFDLTEPRGKSQAVEQLLPVISEIADSVVRAHHIQRLARLVNVDEKLLLPKNKPVKADSASSTAPFVIHSARDHVEAYFLALLLQHPEFMSEAAALDYSDFSSSEYRYIFQMLQNTPTLQELVGKLADPIREEVVYLATLSLLPMDSEMRREEVTSLVRRLREMHIKRLVKDNASQLRDAQAAVDGDQVRELQQRGVELANRLIQAQRAPRAL